MPLELITGPANAGVTERVRTKLVARARSGDRTLLLVPSGPDVSRVTRELAAEIALGIGVRAFDNHLDALWEAFGDGRAIVTGVQRLVVLEESVNACAPALVAAPGRTTSAVRMVARIVQRAAESPHGISSEGVEGVAADLLHCVSVYESTLRRAGFIERGEAHRLASRLFGEVDLPALIAINGFSGLTRAQEQCVVNAAARTDVLVGLTYDPEFRPRRPRALWPIGSARQGPRAFCSRAATTGCRVNSHASSARSACPERRTSGLTVPLCYRRPGERQPRRGGSPARCRIPSVRACHPGA